MKHGFGRDCQQISRLLIVPLLLIVLLLAQLAGHSHVATPGTNALQQVQNKRYRLSYSPRSDFCGSDRR